MNIRELQESVTGVLCNLKWNLDARGIHYTEFAKDMEISRRTVNNWFANYGSISVNNAFKILNYLNSKDNATTK